MSEGTNSIQGARLPFVPDPKERWSVDERVLLRLGELQGPKLDVVDVTDVDGVGVREIVVHFRDTDPPVSPAHVRAVLHDLLEKKHVVPSGLDHSGSFMEAHSGVRLTCRGLVAARLLDPACGRVRHVVTFRTTRCSPMLDARFVTGDTARDESLNASGTVLAAAFVVLVYKPTRERPLIVDNCGPYFERLTMFGVRNRPGPKSEQVASPDAIRDAFEKLAKVLNLSRGYYPEDQRRDFYFLSGPLPEIRIEPGDSRHYGEWQSYSYPLWYITEGQVKAGQAQIGGIPDAMDHLFPPAADVGQKDSESRAPRKPRKKKDSAWLKSPDGAKVKPKSSATTEAED